jgi:hypothetical protein
MILRAMLAVAYATVGPSLPDRSRVMTQTKRNTLVLQVRCLGWGLQSHTVKQLIDAKVEQRNKLDKFNDDGRKRTRYIYLVIARSLPALEVLCIELSGK